MVATPQPEKQILWHPRWQNKFVVGGGSQISMYEWCPDQSEIRYLSSQSDLSFMKCFTWSPDPAFDDLFAVGLVSGRVDLVRLEATRAARNNILSSSPLATLPVRNSRSCNALAFCHADPNYLAVGLDKVRGDSSLIIWDVQSCLPAVSVPNAALSPVDALTTRPHPRIARADVAPRDARMMQHHAPTEVVSALSFLAQSTHLLLAGMSARWLRLFDLRSPTSSATNVATKVSGIAVNPLDPNQFACCGDAAVTVWDIRRLPHPILTFTEKDAVADGARPRPGSVVHHIEFSSHRRGMLAVMEKEAAHVRFWDIRKANTPDGFDGDRSRDSSQARVPRRSWTNLPWTASVHGARQGPSDHQELSAMVLADTRKTKQFSRPLASFALVPCSRSLSLTSEVMVVNKEGDLELYALHDTPKQISWSSRGDLAVGAGLSHKIFPAYQDKVPSLQPGELPINHVDDETLPRGRGKSGISSEKAGRSDEPVLSALDVTSPSDFPSGDEPVKPKAQPAQHEKSLPRNRKSASRSVQQVVEDDISMTMRRRVIRGYGIDNTAQNAELTSDASATPSPLSELWAWIRRSRELLGFPTPRIHGYDFSYQGLLGIWDGFPSLTRNKSSVTPSVENPSPSVGTTIADSSSSSTFSLLGFSNLSRTHLQSTEDLSYGDFDVALDVLLSRQEGRASSLSLSLKTNKMKQRQCALQLCGWTLMDDSLSTVIKTWEKDGQHSRAACWLVFTKQYTKALELLMRSKDETHHIMTGTLAALIPGSPKNNELREHTERLIVRLQDPYLRAMLTQLTSRDWSDVLEEEALPLLERLAIAFQFLDDRALSLYLHRTVERACMRGDIEGLIVTGMTPRGMDILQNYVDRSGDVQTAAILSSYVCPARFQDTRSERWLESYRDLLDGLKLFHHRVNFDIARGQILRDAVQNGDLPPTFEWAPRHILIRCNYCSKPMNPVSGASVGKNRVTACPQCGRAMPRCCVCLMTLSIFPDISRDAELLSGQATHKDTMEDAIIICQACRHGGHASHILDWFFGEEGARSHGECPVANCNCHCGEL